MLNRALQTAVAKAEGDAQLTRILQTGEVYDAVENWQASSISFLNGKGRRITLGYKWDWIENRPADAIAENLLAKLTEAVANGDLP
jgi:hypothetical protein